MNQDNYYLWSISISVVSVVIGGLMVGIAIRQISNLSDQIKEAVKSNSIAALDTLLKLEEQLADRREKFKTVGIELCEYKGDDEKEKNILELNFNEAKQMYLNGLDRLCASILRGYFLEDEMRRDYKDMIKETIKELKDDFHAATPYRNIIKINEKWSE